MTLESDTALSRIQFFAPNVPAEAQLLGIAQHAFIAGTQPHCAAVALAEVPDGATLLPPGATPGRTVRSGLSRAHLTTGPGWTLYASRRPDGNASIWVGAVTAELADEVAELAAASGRGPATGPGSVTVGFWHSTSCRTEGTRTPRQLDVPGWDDIRRNYTAAARPELERLMALRPGDITGRLVLLHGPAGTGKTTVLRALARSWRDWCRMEYILDPESLFARPDYLMAVALGEVASVRPGAEAAPSRHRMIVLEDCDELVRAEAKQDSGQALSRLLNLTDGLLGQGLDVLVCLTTNEDVARLHPAVVRPGRCLAEIEIGPLPAAESAAWLGVRESDGPGPATLAELYRS
ncbi:DUF5925 domain-containing protein [Pseudonocardia sp.]|uniref:DUF5925 domain-containing protein n=1 Tax=Pseudonocardia sp. TaxID=60912 RepID=UPI003D13D5D4